MPRLNVTYHQADAACEMAGLPRPQADAPLFPRQSTTAPAVWKRQRIAVFEWPIKTNRRFQNLLNRLAARGWAVVYYDVEEDDIFEFRHFIAHVVRGRSYYVRPGRKVRHKPEDQL